MAIHSPIIFKKIKKVPSFIHNRDVHELNDLVPSPSFKAKFVASEEQQFRQEWERLQKAVFDLYSSFKKILLNKNNAEVLRTPKTLAGLHDDVHVLMRSKAGSFVYDFFQKRILPTATQILFEAIVQSAPDSEIPLEIPDNQSLINSSNVKAIRKKETSKAEFELEIMIKAWKHFYSHILPDLEMIFAQVKSQSQDTIRTAAITEFRDGIILELEQQIMDLLQARSEISEYLPALKQMFLVLQGVSEKYPPTENKLRLESLVALVVSPYLGHRGIYKDYSNKPVLVSNELGVAHLRRLSVADPRKLSRPLSMHSNKPVETLQDLFVLSADRTRHLYRTKTGNKEGRKRSVSTSEELFSGTLGY